MEKTRPTAASVGKFNHRTSGVNNNTAFSIHSNTSINPAIKQITKKIGMACVKN
jgi:hypothetical protein